LDESGSILGRSKGLPQTENVQTGPRDHTAPTQWVQGVLFPGGLSERGVMLIIPHSAVPKNSTAAYDVTACTWTTLPAPASSTIVFCFRFYICTVLYTGLSSLDSKFFPLYEGKEEGRRIKINTKHQVILQVQIYVGNSISKLQIQVAS
jgi:hypothetical protein